MDSLNNKVKAAKADIVILIIESKMKLSRFEEHVCSLQALVNGNVERMMSLTEAMTRARKLLENDRSINKSDYSVKIPKLTAKVQRLTGVVES